MNSIHGFKRVKVVALSVRDLGRANEFYGKVLGLESAGDADRWKLGELDLLLKPEWQTPTAEPNPRLTVEVEDSRETEKTLKAAGVTISDPVQLYEDKFLLGSFLDSEGNKFWICSQV